MVTVTGKEATQPVDVCVPVTRYVVVVFGLAVGALVAESLKEIPGVHE